jgi:hypothetical protein
MPLPRRLPSVLVPALALLAGGLVAAPAEAADVQKARFTSYSSSAELLKGSVSGARVSGGTVTLRSPRQTLTRSGTRYRYGAWTSPWTATGFDARTLVPSWNATTPKGTWLRVQVRVRKGSKVGSWDTVADWASGTDAIARTSLSAQTDDLAQVSTDTVVTRGSNRFRHWQVRVLLLRKNGSSATPSLRSVTGVAAGYRTRSASTSRTTMTTSVELNVPYSSQMVHRGHHGGRYGAGGEAWCSPTSVSMVLRYWRSGPTAAQYAWTREKEGYVDHAARLTIDKRYGGTGNWPFNTAYASTFGLDAFVTRLYDLRDAERFIKAGIPVVVSVAFAKGRLTGAPISATNGHLMVIRGFTKGGRVIANDPAGSSSTAAQVRRVYDRAQFERAWLGGSGGITYVLRPASRALPADTPRW